LRGKDMIALRPDLPSSCSPLVVSKLELFRKKEATDEGREPVLG
jgi:hypothetical protein